MKTTGVIRRIDELGRIVIPKEIRKNLRIKNGDSLEIFLESDNIILKKYSQLETIENVSVDYVEAFNTIIKHNIIVTDRDKVIAVSGPLKKKYLGKEISKEVEDIINKRRTTIDNETQDIQITEKLSEECKYIISSVIVSGDAVGSVIILSDEEISDLIEKSANFIARFLSKHLE